MNKNEKFFIDSSFMKHVAFDESNSSLIVTFASGSIWIYHKITLDIYKGLIAAPSIGGYFNSVIRNKYVGEVVARVGKTSLIIYSKGEDIELQKQKETG